MTMSIVEADCFASSILQIFWFSRNYKITSQVELQSSMIRRTRRTRFLSIWFPWMTQRVQMVQAPLFQIQVSWRSTRKSNFNMVTFIETHWNLLKGKKQLNSFAFCRDRQIKELEYQVEGLKLELERLRMQARTQFEQLQFEIAELKQELLLKVTRGLGIPLGCRSRARVPNNPADFYCRPKNWRGRKTTYGSWKSTSARCL